MATTMHYSNERMTIDALWTILSQQTENVKKALAARLKESLAKESGMSHKSMEEAWKFVDTLSIKGENDVPADEI